MVAFCAAEIYPSWTFERYFRDRRSLIEQICYWRIRMYTQLIRCDRKFIWRKSSFDLRELKESWESMQAWNECRAPLKSNSQRISPNWKDRHSIAETSIAFGKTWHCLNESTNLDFSRPNYTRGCNQNWRSRPPEASSLFADIEAGKRPSPLVPALFAQQSR